MKTENRKERVSSFEDLEAWQAARAAGQFAIYVAHAPRESLAIIDIPALQSGSAAGGVDNVEHRARGSSEHIFKRRSSFTMSRAVQRVKFARCCTLSPTISRKQTTEAERLRDEVTTVGKLVTGLLQLDRQTPRYRSAWDRRRLLSS